MTLKIPPKYHWLLNEPGPRMLVEALALYGTLEAPGAADNPEIIAWAHEINRNGTTWISDMFDRGGDAVPWCGLFMGVVAHRAGKSLPSNPLRALAWSGWGTPVQTPKLGDVLTFNRTGGGHVGLYVGEDEIMFHVLGGNQDNSVKIIRIKKSRLYGASHLYQIGQPGNCRRVFMAPEGPVSENEA